MAPSSGEEPASPRSRAGCRVDGVRGGHDSAVAETRRETLIYAQVRATRPQKPSRRYRNRRLLKYLSTSRVTTIGSWRLRPNQSTRPVYKSTSVSGAPDNSSRSHFSAMTRSCWPRRAARNRHRHAIEQASRRWREGRRDGFISRRRRGRAG